MTATAEPSVEHIDAAATLRRAIGDPNATTPRGDNEHINDWQIRALLAEVEALTDIIPDAAMIDALTRHGALTERRRSMQDGYSIQWEDSEGRSGSGGRASRSERRLVTPWKVAP